MILLVYLCFAPHLFANACDFCGSPDGFFVLLFFFPLIFFLLLKGLKGCLLVPRLRFFGRAPGARLRRDPEIAAKSGLPSFQNIDFQPLARSWSRVLASERLGFFASPGALGCTDRFFFWRGGVDVL